MSPCLMCLWITQRDICTATQNIHPAVEQALRTDRRFRRGGRHIQ
uniref:Uncharacterized protein n=1 Tax=Anguilla anguilla TaxID=7936 RepID=A0A0E9U926_ANGAN